MPHLTVAQAIVLIVWTAPIWGLKVVDLLEAIRRYRLKGARRRPGGGRSRAW
jgi:hypothetical protein